MFINSSLRTSSNSSLYCYHKHLIRSSYQHIISPLIMVKTVSTRMFSSSSISHRKAQASRGLPDLSTINKPSSSISPCADDLIVFGGRASSTLAKDICKQLHIPFSNTNVKSFADGEIYVRYDDSVRGKDVVLIQSTCKPVNDNYMELFITLDAISRGQPNRIITILPYFGYARQDRINKSHEPLSSKLVADFIGYAGATQVVTIDIHAEQEIGFFNIPVDNLCGSKVFANYILEERKNLSKDLVLVSPDAGGVKRAKKMQEYLTDEGISSSIAMMNKTREKANVVSSMELIGNVEGKNVIIVDDIVDTAGTLCAAADILKKDAGAVSVRAMTSHGILSSPAIDRINESLLEELVILDTIQQQQQTNIDFSKITSVSVAPLLSEAISRLHNDEPLSTIC